VVYGVHIVNRWLEDPRLSAFAATRTTGHGVAYAALTTVAGLLSIVFARHKGVADFGTILLVGIVACMLAALFVLPAVIDLLYEKPEARRRVGPPRGEVKAK
jgi:predicted RND superfamily exporter protein